MQRAKWWTNHDFWILVGVAVLFVVNGITGMSWLSGAGEIAIAGVAVAFIVVDGVRSAQQHRGE